MLRGPRTDRRIQLVLVCWLIGCVVALGEQTEPGVPTELWPPVAIGFIGLTLLWDGRSRPGRPAVVATVAMVVTFWLVAIAFSHPPLEALGMAVPNIAGSWLMAALHAHQKGSRDWAPYGARSLASLAGSAAVASAVVALFGGFPDLAIGELAPITLWWVIRSTIFAFIGSATFLIFFHGDLARWRAQPRPPLSAVVLLVPVSLACMYVVYLDPDLPLSWFMLIPAVWAGVMLTPYAAAIHSLMQALAAGVLAFTEADRFSYEGFLPASLVIDLLLAASTFVALQIALLRDERERALSAERSLRQRADAQSTLLGQVFDSMTDGMMLFTAGRLVRHNPAARHLLGRPLPAFPPDSWAAYLGLTCPDGKPLEGLGLPGASGRRRHTSTVAIDHGEDRRILEIGSWPISDTDIMVLITDVTNQRHRMAELSRFAGIVSHDLRTPLTSLHGWLELATEAHADGEDVAPLLERAFASSQRMEHVIGGWINYTVVREGVLSPEPVPLAELATDLLPDPGGGTPNGEPCPGPRIEVDAPHVVHADRDLVRQLLANLVGNALKFARPGHPAHVEITSREDDEAGWIRIDVSDHGLGLPEDQEELIFEEFHRAAEHSDGVEGTGLGLSLCRTIVARHGGSISAHTNEHGGATFTMSLPAAR